jgi:hypothetical protein
MYVSVLLTARFGSRGLHDGSRRSAVGDLPGTRMAGGIRLRGPKSRALAGRFLKEANDGN